MVSLLENFCLGSLIYYKELFNKKKKVSEYGKAMPQSHNVDRPTHRQTCQADYNVAVIINGTVRSDFLRISSSMPSDTAIILYHSIPLNVNVL